MQCQMKIAKLPHIYTRHSEIAYVHENIQNLDAQSPKQGK